MEVKYRPAQFYPKVRITREMIRENRRLRLFIRLRMLFLVLNPAVAVAGMIIVMARVF